jgi:hypothetical protein
MDKYQGIKIKKIRTIGKPLSLKAAKWKPVLTVSSEDLKALKRTIRAAEKKENNQ